MHGKAEEESIAVTMGDDENAARRRLGGASVKTSRLHGTAVVPAAARLAACRHPAVEIGVEAGLDRGWSRW